MILHFSPSYDSFGKLLPPGKNKGIKKLSSLNTFENKYDFWKKKNRKEKFLMKENIVNVKIRSVDEMKSSQQMREILSDSNLLKGIKRRTITKLKEERKNNMIEELHNQKLKYEKAEEDFLNGAQAARIQDGKNLFFKSSNVYLGELKKDKKFLLKEEVPEIKWRKEKRTKYEMLNERKKKDFELIKSKRKRIPWFSLQSRINLSDGIKHKKEVEIKTRSKLLKERKINFFEEAEQQKQRHLKRLKQYLYNQRNYIKELPFPHWLAKPTFKKIHLPLKEKKSVTKTPIYCSNQILNKNIRNIKQSFKKKNEITDSVLSKKTVLKNKIGSNIYQTKRRKKFSDIVLRHRSRAYDLYPNKKQSKAITLSTCSRCSSRKLKNRIDKSGNKWFKL
eukprot:snap_masked-scaffold_10-processed-gene-5.51-mRNA-1 protein AED:1.00 eAED:1.00 QI:0/-1/0/0/-1/1/1/0/390